MSEHTGTRRPSLWWIDFICWTDRVRYKVCSLRGTHWRKQESHYVSSCRVCGSTFIEGDASDADITAVLLGKGPSPSGEERT